MTKKTGPYVNHILRGIQEALETNAHGSELIERARRAKLADKWLKVNLRLSAEHMKKTTENNINEAHHTR